MLSRTLCAQENIIAAWCVRVNVPRLPISKSIAEVRSTAAHLTFNNAYTRLSSSENENHRILATQWVFEAPPKSAHNVATPASSSKAADNSEIPTPASDNIEAPFLNEADPLEEAPTSSYPDTDACDFSGYFYTPLTQQLLGFVLGDPEIEIKEEEDANLPFPDIDLSVPGQSSSQRPRFMISEVEIGMFY